MNPHYDIAAWEKQALASIEDGVAQALAAANHDRTHIDAQTKLHVEGRVPFVRAILELNNAGTQPSMMAMAFVSAAGSLLATVASMFEDDDRQIMFDQLNKCVAALLAGQMPVGSKGSITQVNAVPGGHA